MNSRLTDSELVDILSLSQNATAIYRTENIVIETASDTMIAFWGKDRSVIGMRLEDAVPELKGQPFVHLLQEVWRTGITYEAKDTPAQLLVDGRLQTFYFDFAYRAIKRDNGTIYCILHTATDVTRQYLLKQENEKTEFLLRLAVEGTNMGSWLVKPATKEFTYTSNLETMFGYRGNEKMSYDAMLAQVSDDQRSKLGKEVRQAIATGTNFDIIYAQRRFDNGNLIWLRTLGKAMREETGNGIVVSGMVLDITEPITSRFKIEESESKYRTLFNSMDEGFCIIERFEENGLTDFRYLEANPAFATHTGVDDIVGKTIREAFPGELSGIYLYDNILKTGIPVRDERAMSSGRILEFYAYPAGDAAKQQIAVLFKDVTQRNTSQMILKESEERFRNMAESSDVLITMSDETMGTSYLNGAWTKLTGRSVNELLHFGWVDMVHPEDRERFFLQYLTAFNKRVPFQGEFRIINARGTYTWLYAQCAPRFRSDGSFAGYIASALDITERKEDEQRKNDFIGMVSHEMKTPLTSLNGYLQLLQMRIDANDAIANNMLGKAAKQVNRMTTLINGFLNVSRLESGKIHIDKQRFDMAVLVQEAEEEVQATINSHKVVFAPVQTTWVNADRDKINQVISNLVNNAVKYSPANTEINVACVTIDGNATVSVKDEGIGIKADDQPKLFDRYYRVNHDKGSSVSGFGIGLYLCAEIIQRHDGKIWVDSEVGKGSMFSFSLPVVE